MSKELRSIVNAKKKVFREFYVEWNDDIEKILGGGEQTS